MLGAEVIAKCFSMHDIERVYMYAGGTIAPLLDAILKEGITYFCARHEQGAGYAAMAHARLTKTPQVVMVTSGPGATNLVTCVADAYFDSTPLVVITGQVGTKDMRGDRPVRQRGFQEIDCIAMMKPVAKAAFLASNIEDLPALIDKAFYIASTGRLGPVVIDLPMDIQRSEVFKHYDSSLKPVKKKFDIDSAPIEQLATLFAQAERPTLLAGQGVLLSNATAALRHLSAKYDIPVVTSLLGLSAVDTSDVLSMGFLGHTGMQYANATIHHSDLVVALGARLDVRQTGTEVNHFIPKGKLVRVDLDEHELAYSRVRCDLEIQGDCCNVLEAVMAEFERRNFNKQYPRWLSNCQMWKHQYQLHWDHEKTLKEALYPQAIIEELSHLVGSRQCIVTTGVGSHQQWVARHFHFDYPKRQWLTSGGHGAMGYDLPSAVGASLSHPDALVLCFVGDGSFQINMQELGSIAEHKLNIKIIVLDNKRLGIVSQFQLFNWKDDPSTGKKWNPAFDKIAQEGYGIKASFIDHPKQLEEHLSVFLNGKGPALIHCHVKEDVDVNPMLLAGQKLNHMWPHAEPVELNDSFLILNEGELLC